MLSNPLRQTLRILAESHVEPESIEDVRRLVQDPHTPSEVLGNIFASITRKRTKRYEIKPWRDRRAHPLWGSLDDHEIRYLLVDMASNPSTPIYILKALPEMGEHLHPDLMDLILQNPVFPLAVMEDPNFLDNQKPWMVNDPKYRAWVLGPRLAHYSFHRALEAAQKERKRLDDILFREKSVRHTFLSDLSKFLPEEVDIYRDFIHPNPKDPEISVETIKEYSEMLDIRTDDMSWPEGSVHGDYIIQKLFPFFDDHHWDGHSMPQLYRWEFDWQDR